MHLWQNLQNRDCHKLSGQIYAIPVLYLIENAFTRVGR
jgi:hypothetical protein